MLKRTVFSQSMYFNINLVVMELKNKYINRRYIEHQWSSEWETCKLFRPTAS